MKLLVKFRAGRLRELALMAVDQKWGQKVTGQTHLGLICPTCGRMTILSVSQNEARGHRIQNAESELRRHGLSVPGKPQMECRGGVLDGAA